MTRKLEIPRPLPQVATLNIRGFEPVTATVNPGETAVAIIRDGKPAIQVRKSTPEDIADYERRAKARAAQGIEAGTATTEGRGPKDKSPVAESDAP